ncbi:MAG: lipocalin-like domain-containing protein [Anaerolineales bacterium]|jgi:predicted secreted hydrolase
MYTHNSTKIILVFLTGFALVTVGILIWWNLEDDTRLSGQLIGVDSGSQEIPAGFTRATRVIPLDFPETYGPHPDYRTEWWYYTGNLETAGGRHFGYQLTFFRQALIPEEARPDSPSDWRTSQLFFAHFTLTDVAGEQFTFRERFSRGGIGLAGAQTTPYRVWLEDWEVRKEDDNVYQLSAREGEIALSLTLVDEKGPVLQGVDGFSQKGPDPGDASYYYSQPRLRSNGTVAIGEAQYLVEGWSWKDHEFSTSVLSEEQVGWDWFSFQLDDGTDLMLYYFRREDGSIDPFSSGTLISPDGETRLLAPEDFNITVLDTWESPHSGAEYPAEWQIAIPQEDLELTATPYLRDQELLVTVIYWEGAVQVAGTHAGQPVMGSGYVELTGYAQDMRGWL